MADTRTGIVAVESTTLARWVQIGLASGRVLNIDFLTEAPGAAENDHPLAQRVRAYLDDGAVDDFADVEIALTVPTAQRRVYETLREIGYGEELELADLAAVVPLDESTEDAVAIVRSALVDNPIPIVIPDHRVTDGAGATPDDVRQRLRQIEELA